jgi:hypothetical protein
MVTDADIDALYESTLKPRLESLEGLRHEVKGYVARAAILVGISACCCPPRSNGCPRWLASWA